MKWNDPGEETFNIQNTVLDATVTFHYDTADLKSGFCLNNCPTL